jgi:arylsulfatase A-like enzyme
MKMKETLKITTGLGIIVVYFVLLPLSTGCSSRPGEAGKPPNLLFLMTDQQRFDALSFAGNTVLETPNLNRLAIEGAWFKNAYTPCAVCTPARASILTGCNVANTGVISNSLAYAEEETGIMPMQTYDEILDENGYTCEYYGKWHTPTFRARIYKNPVTVAGKSSSELGPGKKTAYLDYLAPHIPPREVLQGEFMDTYTQRPYQPHPIDKRYDQFIRGEEVSSKVGQSDIHGVTTIPTDYHISAFDGAKTIKALERLKDSTFSLTCSFHHPHPPYLGARSYVDLYPTEKMPVPESINDEMENSPYLNRKQRTSPRYSDPENIQYFTSEYYAMVKEVDDWVGKILDKLDELGLTDNTLVVFTSDHGEMLGAHGMYSKMVFYEESAHIPLMIRFPGRIKPGTRVDSYVSTVNLFATILDYLNMPGKPSDGFSLRGLIKGTDEENGEYVVTEWLSSLKTSPSHMVIKDGWKLMIPDSSAKRVMKALYNMNADPYEMNNLLGNNPDAYKYNAKVEDLETCFQDWMARTRYNQYR